jgi:hypothetical protein
MTLIGFAYGVWPGFLIASLGSMAGGAFAFLSVRVSGIFHVFCCIQNADVTGLLPRDDSPKLELGSVRQSDARKGFDPGHHDPLLPVAMGCR